jgi:hypothetical protein
MKAQYINIDFGTHFHKSWDPKNTTAPIDHRGRIIKFENGKRVLHEPTKQIEDCFLIESISWTFTGTDRAGKKMHFKTASGVGERNFRQENKQIYTFA